MNQAQTNKVNMYDRLNLFFIKYQSVLNTFNVLWQIVVSFQNSFSELETYMQMQQSQSTADTANKNLLLKQLQEILLPLTRKAKVWAKQQNFVSLAVQFDISAKDFKQPYMEVYAFACNIIAALRNNAAGLAAFNITPAQIADAQTAADNYHSNTAKPQQAIKLAKSGTEGVVRTMNTINEIIRQIDDLLINEYSVSNADMVAEYRNNRLLGLVHKRHTHLTVHVYADAAHTQPVEGATVLIAARNKNAVTDNTGMAEIVQFDGGKLTGIISAAGFADTAFSFTITSGQELELAVVMTPLGDPKKEKE